MNPDRAEGAATKERPLQLVLSEKSHGICRIVMNSPQNRNALSEEMMSALSVALHQSESDDDVRVIILAANGPVFCAGHDLKQLTAARSAHEDKGRAYYRRIMASCSALMQQIVHHPKPVIAEVEGVATAAGCQLVASCDLAIAGAEARFATPGVQIGLFCSTPMVALSRNVSRKHAMEMLLTGEPVSAIRAEQIGLVNYCIPAGQAGVAARGMAEKIAAKSKMTISIGKKAFYQQAEMTLASAYEHASAVMVENMMKRDAEEGINAFIEKRTPQWRDE